MLARTVVTYATWEELTAWSQASLFGDPIDTAPAEAVELWSMEMVFDAGVKAHGENIAVEECPFDVWSSNGAKWLEGWRASEARARASQEEGVTKPAAVRGGRRKVQPLDVSDVPRKGGVH
jgi:ribosome modulation factor